MKLNWGWRIAIVYTVFALGTLSFVGFALTKDVDLVRPDYYEQGLKHDDHVRAIARAQALTPSPACTIANGVLRCALPPSMAGALLEIELYCASQTRQDKAFTSTVAADGVITIPLSGYTAAPWKLTATWRHAGQLYRLEHPFTVAG